MTLAGLLVLAALDSINPSAIVVTLYLLSRSEASVQVGVYVATIFLTYFTFGLLMILGIGAVLPSIGPLFGSAAGLIGQGLIGLALLAYSLKGASHPTETAVTAPSARTYVALAALGVTVTVMELPTALPYFAAIALITSAGLPSREWLPLLIVYNVIFVMPPVMLLLGHVFFEHRLRGRYAELRLRLQRGAHETALWIAGLVGGGLFVTSAIELVARLR